MPKTIILLVTGLLAAHGGVAWAGEPRPLFADDSIVELSLEGPLRDTFGDREARDEHPFTLRVGPGGAAALPLEVRVRGKSRAIACKYAPLRLNFAPKATRGTLFEGQNKLKLVLPCDGTNRAEGDLLEEYAVYRIFNLLSERSFRVRLLQIRLIDTEKQPSKPLLEGHAFLLEPDEELAERLGLPEAHVPHLRLGELDADQAATVFIFQYLVGNTDWSLVAATGESDCCHNIRLLGEGRPLYVVPYDFDQTGLVNARYAQPHPGLHLRNVTQRLYRGYCIDSSALGPALDRIIAQRDEVLAVPRSLPGLSERQIESEIKYLEGFYKRAGDRERLLGDFRDRCL